MIRIFFEQCEEERNDHVGHVTAAACWACSLRTLTVLTHAWCKSKKIPQNLDYLSRIPESRAFFKKVSGSGLFVWPPPQLASFLLLGTRVALRFFGLCGLGHILSKWSFFQWLLRTFHYCERRSAGLLLILSARFLVSSF